MVRKTIQLTSLTLGRPCITVRSTTELLLVLPPILRLPSTLAIPPHPVICVDAADADDDEEDEEEDTSVASALPSKAK